MLHIAMLTQSESEENGYVSFAVRAKLTFSHHRLVLFEWLLLKRTVAVTVAWKNFIVFHNSI